MFEQRCSLRTAGPGVSGYRQRGPPHIRSVAGLAGSAPSLIQFALLLQFDPIVVEEK